MLYPVLFSNENIDKMKLSFFAIVSSY